MLDAFNEYKRRVACAINDEFTTSAAQVGRVLSERHGMIVTAFRNGLDVVDVAHALIATI